MKDSREATELERNISMMTALPRSEWAKVRQSLLGKNLVEKIEGAVMHVCLDDLTTSKEPSELVKVWLSGNKQRWFDKSITLHIVSGFFYSKLKLSSE